MPLSFYWRVIQLCNQVQIRIQQDRVRLDDREALVVKVREQVQARMVREGVGR